MDCFIEPKMFMIPFDGDQVKKLDGKQTAGAIIGGASGFGASLGVASAVIAPVAAVSGPLAILTVPAAIAGCVIAGSLFGMQAGAKNPAGSVMGFLGFVDRNK